MWGWMVGRFLPVCGSSVGQQPPTALAQLCCRGLLNEWTTEADVRQRSRVTSWQTIHKVTSAQLFPPCLHWIISMTKYEPNSCFAPSYKGVCQLSWKYVPDTHDENVKTSFFRSLTWICGTRLEMWAVMWRMLQNTFRILSQLWSNVFRTSRTLKHRALGIFFLPECFQSYRLSKYKEILAQMWHFLLVLQPS